MKCQHVTSLSSTLTCDVIYDFWDTEPFTDNAQWVYHKDDLGSKARRDYKVSLVSSSWQGEL